MSGGAYQACFENAIAVWMYMEDSLNYVISLRFMHRLAMTRPKQAMYTK